MDEGRKRFEELAENVRQLKAEGWVDLSSDEDLALAVMNLVSLEEHFFMTGEKTGRSEYFNFLSGVREMRKKTLSRAYRQK